MTKHTIELVRKANELLALIGELSAEMDRYARDPKFRGQQLYMTDAGYAERSARCGKVSEEWRAAFNDALRAVTDDAGLLR